MENINDKVFDVMYSAGLCWTADKRALQDEFGNLSGSYGMFRSDNNVCLGTVGNDYRPMQNSDLVREFIDATKEFGLTKIEGVCVKGGKKVVLKAKIGDIKIGNDTVHRYITASNTHDGSSHIRLGIYNRVLVCSNGMTREISGHELGRVKHTTNAQDKMNWYIRNIPTVLAAEEKMMQNYQRLSEIPANDEHIKAVIKKVYEVDPEADPETISGKKRAQLDRFMQALRNNGLNVHGNTLWGILGGMTYVNSRDTKGTLNMDRQMIGKTQEMSELTYDLLMSIVNKQELEFVEA